MHFLLVVFNQATMFLPLFSFRNPLGPDVRMWYKTKSIFASEPELGKLRLFALPLKFSALPFPSFFKFQQGEEDSVPGRSGREREIDRERSRIAERNCASRRAVGRFAWGLKEEA
jgi:hypothetical protein